VRISTLLDDLLNYARISQSTAEFKKVEVKKLIDDLLKSIEINIKEKQANVIVKGDLPDVKGDASQINQLFQNMILNGIKFQDKNKPEIIISAKRKASMIEFAIKDNGIGMDPKYFDKIFIIFQRLHTKEAYEGTGMGLAICKRIVERAGGRIWVESEHGRGSTFYFTIP